MRSQVLKKLVAILAMISIVSVILIQVQHLCPVRIHSIDLSKIEEDIPHIFKPTNLWRQPSFEQVSNSSSTLTYDRWVFQRQWAINVSRSDYMKYNVKKKKRILVNGLFNLDDEERLLPCDEVGVNFSQYCALVEDHPSIPYINFDEFDAVLSRRDWTHQFYEPKVPPRLISFFHIQESPYTLHQGDFRPNNPVLASYWRGSDIEAPYFKWVPYQNSRPSQSQHTSSKKNYAQNKDKLAAIVVSHCPTSNDRLGYVYQLQKYISLDIYGRCGSIPCDNTCFTNISRDYKFYLAFENANCRDYITEKFFLNALGHDMVPVVLGAHPEDYKYAAPPNSYIHVQDFSSVKALADYLTLLDQNDTLYNKYFEWKGTGQIVSGHYDIFCRVCAFLFYADFHPPPVWKDDAYNWLQVNPCLKPGEHFWKTTESL